MGYSARIRQLRREQKLTLTALAQKAEISRGYLSEIEHGHAADPSAAVLKRLADALGTTTAVLMAEDPRIQPTEIPTSLRDMADEDDIPDEDVQMLALVKFRGFQPVSPDDWRYLYESIKRSMPRDVDIS